MRTKIFGESAHLFPLISNLLAIVVVQAFSSPSNTKTPLPRILLCFSNNNKKMTSPYHSAGDWNRELSKPKDYDASLPIIQKARILCLSDPLDETNAKLYDSSQLPASSKLVGIGKQKEDFDWYSLHQEPPTVIFISTTGIRDLLAELLTEFAASIQWVHSKSAGIEHTTSDTLAKSEIVMTNAKGHFSSTLAEYGMMACSYFAKDIPRLLKQKKERNWEKYDTLELRGATMGIVGYGDIGQATARLARAYGMKVIALRRKKKHNDNEKRKRDGSNGTENGDSRDIKMYYTEENANALNDLCAESDYIYCAAPLTPQTRGLIGKEQLDTMKSTAVLINVGRGPVIDEEALIDALKTSAIKGAGLDVTTIEPLAKESPLWELHNVLISPHNMDQTATFQYEATDFFLEENLPRFQRGLPLYNVIDKAAGY